MFIHELFCFFLVLVISDIAEVLAFGDVELFNRL
jgi:hypothetical protein